MRINEYVKRWYDEDYDVRQEDFYMTNAYWVVKRHWMKGGIINGVFAFLMMVPGFLIGGSVGRVGGIIGGILGSLTALAIVTISFFFYAIREYDENDWATSKITYLFVLIFLLLTKGKVSVVTQWIVSIMGTVLYVYLTFVKPIQILKLKKEMKRKIKEMEEQEEAANKQSYAQWEKAYKAYRYGLPEYDIPDGDPMMAEARAMFEGYINSKDMLKTRYRQLAKKAHPDNGGDEKMFSCIIEVYEELCKRFE